MNTSLIKSLVIFALGAAGGSVVTLKIVKDKYKKIADEEIESVQETCRRKFKEFERRIEEKDVEIEEKVDSLNLYEKVIREHGYNIYNNAPHTLDDEEEDEDYPGDDSAYGEQSVVYKHPIMINEDDYKDSGLDHKKITVSYFIEDQEFCESDSHEYIEMGTFEPVLNSIMKTFLINPSETLYVRDWSHKMDYKIEAYSGSYKEIILGIDEEEEEGYMTRSEFEDYDD